MDLVLATTSSFYPTGFCLFCFASSIKVVVGSRLVFYESNSPLKPIEFDTPFHEGVVA